VLLLAILALAAGLRFAGLDWDRGLLFHPDERRILMVVRQLHWPRPWDWSLVLGPRSPLNPRFFAYGSLPLYLLRLLQALLGVGADRLYLPARALSATFDLLTVATVGLAGRRLGGLWAGLLAAAFLALAVLPIQLAHFATVDTLLTLLSTLAVCALLSAARSGSLRSFLAAGALTGLALATKTSALPLLFVGWVAWMLGTVRGAQAPGIGRSFARLAVGVTAGAFAFLAAQPYSLLDWFRFMVALASEGAMARGAPTIPYTQQYVGTLPYLYPLRQLVLWSLGLPLGLAALAGLAWLTWRGLRWRRTSDLVLLSWFWAYFLIVGAFHTKFARYMAPLIPWLCLMAALLFERLWERARGRRRLGRCVSGLAAAVLLPTLLYALAFAGIYLRPHPWIVASDWLCREVPEGATLAVEYWDDALPVRPGPECAGRHRHVWIDAYAPDGEAKLGQLVAALVEADYVVLASQRLYATISRQPERYPLTSAYYRLLFAEELGFRLVDVRTNYPRLGPIAIIDEPLAGTPLQRPALLTSLRPAPLLLNLGQADESYAVYDHPRTLIFEKQLSLGPERLTTLLRSAAEGSAP
jgi:4-amino-4-deoxy-L-arabinose transferase-like glycosyltransferase